MKVLMCPPRHFAIRYEINPWMKVRNPADRGRAMAQWKTLKKALERKGVRVSLATPSPRQPDMVFTANAGLADGRSFIRSNFRYPERRGEEGLFAKYFKRLRYRISELEPGLFFEGEGDLLRFRDFLIGGYRFRSDIRSHEAVAGVLGRRVISLELTDPHFYHLDTCFAPLDDRIALYYPEAFDRWGAKLIQEFIPQPIAVTAQEAFAMSCNVFAVKKTVFMHKATPRLGRILSEAGFTVQEIPTSEFIKAGGSVKCMVLRLS